MADFKIFFKPSVEKDLRGLQKDLVARVTEKIEGLRKFNFRRSLRNFQARKGFTGYEWEITASFTRWRNRAID